jgi:glutamine synthetase
VNPRFVALELTEKSRSSHPSSPSISSSKSFGSYVFNRTVMQKMLPKEIFKNIVNAVEGHEKIKPEFADPIAVAIKEWAVTNGATHYSHWFQPLTGTSAEKHDAFIDWASPDEVIETFSGKQLLQGEPDASSFPSGGLRSTYEARGYTGWDPTSPPFLWKGGDGITLCIPTVFFSWTGDVLDSKIPLLRSDKKINDATLRLLKLTGIKANFVNSTLGCEQEYFVIDRGLRNLRPDLVMHGRTVFGNAPPKGQELQDHYFGSVKDRILHFMRDFEVAALELGIPVKTRHNEVAPAQHEVAPVFEKASLAVDHNILLMELMRRIAVKHNLACLLHEKPFQGLNGSGKHCNWSLATDTGINLLDPSDAPGNNLHFLVLLTAILNSIHTHASLLRASIGSAANDFRLGGHEAPPAIISVYLGMELESVLESIENTGSHTRSSTKGKYDFGLPVIPDLTKDNTDRNRTSPFAFTGNKFEFRAVGSSASPALPITTLNTIVAESLNKIVDEIEQNLGTHSSSKAHLIQATIPVIQKYLKACRAIRFSGDNYSADWTKIAQRLKLPNITRSPEAFEAFKFPSTIKAFEGILTKNELFSRFEIFNEIYAHNMNIEVNLMIDLFRTQILPAAFKYQEHIARSINAYNTLFGNVKGIKNQTEWLKEFAANIEKAIQLSQNLETSRKKVEKLSPSAKSKVFSEKILDQCEELRDIVDKIEAKMDDAFWPLPKYRELLFLV